MVTAVDLEAAGLYDPAASNAPDRLALLEWLGERGFTIEQLRAADATNTLNSIAGDAMLLGEAKLSFRDLSAIVGVDVAGLQQIIRASGFALLDPDTAWYGERDIETFTLFAAARELFSPDEILHFTRVMGSAVARVAEAANSLFMDDVERPLTDAGGGEFALAQANLLAIELLDQVSRVMDTLLRMHVRETTERFRDAFRRSPGGGVEMAVGFVDLCGFTAQTMDLSTAQLGTVIREFEAHAYDIVSGNGGRVVKLIGDEVMFTAVTASTVCDIASELVRRFSANEMTPRGGLAFGPVLARGGDYYGPIVNLASRIADQAVPGEVLATPAVAAGAPDHSFTPAGRRLLKGFPEPVDLVSLS